MKIQEFGILSLAIKYIEKRKKDHITPATTEFPMMKFGTRALKHATKELDIKRTIQTTK